LNQTEHIKSTIKKALKSKLSPLQAVSSWTTLQRSYSNRIHHYFIYKGDHSTQERSQPEIFEVTRANYEGQNFFQEFFGSYGPDSTH